jgi:hypothetical protein
VLQEEVTEMKLFEINEKIKVACQFVKTRSGFKHTATLLINGREEESVKVCYLNRTWESYEFESVLQKLQEKTKVLSDEEKEILKQFIKQDHTDNTMFHTVAMVAALGEVFGTTTKEKNDWKARMIKAGLETSGLEMPDDWETLPEPEKEKRLNLIIHELKKVKA